MNQFCGVCKKNAVQSCSACNSIYYCGREHQKSHWKQHKATCVPFKTTNHEDGKILVAIRNIEPGEKIITKLPLLVGPITEKEVICVTCFRKIDQKAVKCKDCGLKLCTSSCLSNKEHSLLCEALKNSGCDVEKCHNIFKFLVPLKILILKSKDFKTYDSIVSNYVYKESREELGKTVSELSSLCQLLALTSSPEELTKILVISKRNFIEIKDPKVANTKALYQIVPLFKQHCIPNTKNVFIGDSNQLSVFATIPIKRGEVLQTNFSEALWGTLERQIYLKTSKYIDCSCERCKDPQELGSYMGSIYCQKCKDNLLEDISPKIISSNPLDVESEWKCERCENTIEARQILFGNKSLTREINGPNMGDPKCLEHFLFKYGEILHPTNSFSLRVKFKLMQLYGNTETFRYEDLPLELLERKIHLCQELLEIAEKIDPGHSRFRGILLYELQTAIVLHAKREFCKELITKIQAEEKLKHSLDLLHESCKILLIEPEFKANLQEKLETLNSMLEI